LRTTRFWNNRNRTSLICGAPYFNFNWIYAIKIVGFVIPDIMYISLVLFILIAFIDKGIVMDLQLSVQSVPITTKAVSLNRAHGEVYSIQHYVIKFVSAAGR